MVRPNVVRAYTAPVAMPFAICCQIIVRRPGVRGQRVRSQKSEVRKQKTENNRGTRSGRSGRSVGRALPAASDQARPTARGQRTGGQAGAGTDGCARAGNQCVWSPRPGYPCRLAKCRKLTLRQAGQKGPDARRRTHPLDGYPGPSEAYTGYAAASARASGVPSRRLGPRR